MCADYLPFLVRGDTVDRRELEVFLELQSTQLVSQIQLRYCQVSSCDSDSSSGSVCEENIIRNKYFVYSLTAISVVAFIELSLAWYK